MSWFSTSRKDQRRGTDSTCSSSILTRSLQAPGVTGMEIFPIHFEKLPGTVRVPQQGWNKVTAQPGCRILKSGAAYFSNSFATALAPVGWQHAGSVPCNQLLCLTLTTILQRPFMASSLCLLWSEVLSLPVSSIRSFLVTLAVTS